MLSRISYTTRACCVALVLCTVSTITPQDEKPSRKNRCKCVHLGQWLHNIVSSTRRAIHSAAPSAPSTPFSQPIVEAKTHSVVPSHLATTPKKKSDTTPSSRFSRKRPDMSAEEELIWAYAYDSNFDNLVAALARNPDPFSDTVFTNAQLTNFLPHNIISYRTKTLEEYVDQYLTKHINRLAQPASTTAQEALLISTPLPEALINLICSYTGQYQLSSNVMQYLGARIEQNIPITGEQVLSLLPYCTDEKGKSLFYYVKQTDHNVSSLINYGIDFFNIRPDDARLILQRRHHIDIGKEMIRQHVNNLQKDPILFASREESDIFFATISDALTEPESYSITGEIKQGESKIFKVGHFDQSDQYKLIQDYITVAPSLLTMHDRENNSIFDHVDACGDEDSKQVAKVTALLKLFLQHGVKPTIQDKNGNTFLHKIAYARKHFSGKYCLDESPFMQLCWEHPDNTIKNNDGQTVMDILNTKISEYEKKDPKMSKSYQRFATKLAINASLQRSAQIFAPIEAGSFSCIGVDRSPGGAKKESPLTNKE